MHPTQKRRASPQFLNRKQARKFHKAARVGSGHRTVMEVAVVRRDAMIGGLGRDPAFRTFAHLIAQFLAASDNSPAGHGPLCLACDTEFSARVLPADFLITTPGAAKGGIGMVTGVCTRCAAQSDAELAAIGLRRLRQIWPDLRPVGTA